MDTEIKEGEIEGFVLNDPDKVMVWTGLLWPTDVYLSVHVIPKQELVSGVKKIRLCAETWLDTIKHKHFSPEMLDDVTQYYFPCWVYSIENYKRYVMVTESELRRVGLLEEK
jgi:hypothetical protein